MTAIQTNRITPEQVKAAYEQTGLKPVQGEYFDRDVPPLCANEPTLACGLGALYRSVFPGGEADGVSVEKWADTKYGCEYRDGFINGFDGCRVMANETDEWKIGHQDGQAAYNLVQPV